MALTDNLIAVWCEDAAPTTDETGNGETLTDNGSVGTATGKVGTAGDFGTGSSTKYLTHADDAALSTGDIDFTVAAWVKLSALTKGYPNILGKASGDAGQIEYMLLYRNGAGAFEWTVKDSNQIRATTFGVPSTGVWIWLCAWHDSVANTNNICVNNGTVDSVSYSGGMVDTTRGFAIGTLGQYVDASSTWDGLVNQVAMWKRVLTSQDRTDIYNAGAGLAYASWGGGAPAAPSTQGLLPLLCA